MCAGLTAGGFDGVGEGWRLPRDGFGAGSIWGTGKTLREADRYRRSSPSSSNASPAGGNLGNGRRFSRAAFERPLAYVQLTDPNARTVAAAVQNSLHQFRWSPLERVRCTPFQANVFLVDQIVVKIADDGEVPRQVDDAMAAVLNMMNV